MAQTIHKPYQSPGFKLLCLFTNGLFLLHLFFSVTLVFCAIFQKDPPVFFQDIFALIFFTPYVFFYFLSDLGLFILLKFKQRRNILLESDFWFATLLGVKYFCIALLIILALYVLWVFSGSSDLRPYN